jgi:hypothetical protein
MRRITRLRTLFAFVALAALASVPHRQTTVSSDIGPTAEHSVVHAALTTLVAQPAFVNQPSRIVVATAEAQRRIVGDVLVAMLAGLALITGRRPRHAQALARAHHSEYWATQPARLRAPPVAA